MLFSLMRVATAAPEPFPELSAILEDPDQLRDFMNVDFGDASQEDIDRYLERDRGIMSRWAAAEPHRDCRQDRCMVTLGRDGRPVMFVERAPQESASAYRRYDHATQLKQFKEHYTLHLEVEGSVRLTINGVEPFLYGTVTDDAKESGHVNDWLVVGANTFALEPLSEKARVRFAVGGHAPFVPSPDKKRANRIAFDGILTEAQTLTLDAPPAPQPVTVSWPEDLGAHLEQGLAIWLAGGDEYAWVPWFSWPLDDVREALRQAGAARLTLAMVDIELPVDDTHFLAGQFALDPTGARWIYAELKERPFGKGTTATEGAYAPFAARATELIADLRAEGCPAAARQVSADDWIASIGADAIADKMRVGSAATTGALRQACALAAAAPVAPVSYRYDDLVFAMRDTHDQVRGAVYGEFSFHYGTPLFSMLKKPMPPR